MSGMKVLVTGGAGYIGSITAKALEQAGHTPVILDSLLVGPRVFVKSPGNDVITGAGEVKHGGCQLACRNAINTWQLDLFYRHPR